MWKRGIQYIALSAALLFTFQLSYTTQRSIKPFRFSPEKLHYHRVAKKEHSDGSSYYMIDETSYAKSINPLLDDLVLSFNKKNYRYRDDTSNYRVSYARFGSTDNEDTREGAAYFYKQEHRIELENSSGLWLGNADDLGSFTIEFRFSPVELNDGAIIFQRVGYNSGFRNGIAISIQRERLNFSLSNIFSTLSGERRSFTYSLDQKLQKGKWYDIALSYQRENGLLRISQNGKEVLLRYMSDDSTSRSTLLKPSFHKSDVPDIIVGQNFFGYLDELRISHRAYDEMKKHDSTADKRYESVKTNERVPVNTEGVITSPVYEFDYSGTMVKDFSWDEELENDSFVWFEIRISDAKFGQYHRSPRWYRITNSQKNIYLQKIEDGLYLRGKYFQWRAHLVPSPDGNSSPKLSNIAIMYELDVPPVPPVQLEVAESGDGYVILQWKKNVDYDIAGYCIYYGIRSGKYEGKLCTVNGRPIQNTSGDLLSVKIDNSLIEENKINDTSNIFLYPHLKNTTLYYFSVTAYDSYRLKTQNNHESDFSKEVKARPFGGSEIKVEHEELDEKEL